jgi:hypothetical protein
MAETKLKSQSVSSTVATYDANNVLKAPGKVAPSNQTAGYLEAVDLAGVANGANRVVGTGYPTGVIVANAYNGSPPHRVLIAICRPATGITIVSDPSGTWDVNTTNPAAGRQSLSFSSGWDQITFYNNSGGPIAAGCVLIVRLAG